MDYLLSTFKAISLTFAVSAVGTGLQAICSPIAHSQFFGLPLNPHPPQSTSSPLNQNNTDRAKSYISLMGARQLATGVIILVFAKQGKWTEVGTILAVIGVLVAGTDGIFIAKGGGEKGVSGGVFHALPGAMIAMLAGTVVYTGIAD